MKLSRAKHIKSIWDSIDESEPDISTEALLERVATICKCDVDDVCEALIATNESGGA